MNFLSRLQGIFFDAQKTFKALSEKPVWVDALITLLVISIIFSYLTAPYIQKDTLKLYKDNEVKLQEKFGKERYEQMVKNIESPTKTLVILSRFVLTPAFILISFLISSLILLVLGRLTSTEGNFVLVFSALIHANFVDKILGNAVRLVLIFTRKSYFQTTTSLALFFPKLETTSPAYIILGQVDIFQLWLFGILAYGLSSIFKIETKKALFISYVFWLLKSLLNIGFGFLNRSFLA